ncbi:MAG TPA: hypothetical protein VLW50_34055 [Streptosporangiaceae bacterium]|nr:hypothetical protein [Streptosporangiaceae bacterium]
MTSSILVTGGTGKVGRLVVLLLDASCDARASCGSPGSWSPAAASISPAPCSRTCSARIRWSASAR